MTSGLLHAVSAHSSNANLSLFDCSLAIYIKSSNVSAEFLPTLELWRYVMVSMDVPRYLWDITVILFLNFVTMD